MFYDPLYIEINETFPCSVGVLEEFQKCITLFCNHLKNDRCRFNTHLFFVCENFLCLAHSRVSNLVPYPSLVTTGKLNCHPYGHVYS